MKVNEGDAEMINQIEGQLTSDNNSGENNQKVENVEDEEVKEDDLVMQEEEEPKSPSKDLLA